jgi:hypothetical protein
VMSGHPRGCRRPWPRRAPSPTPSSLVGGRPCSSEPGQACAGAELADHLKQLGGSSRRCVAGHGPGRGSTKSSAPSTISGPTTPTGHSNVGWTRSGLLQPDARLRWSERHPASVMRRDPGAPGLDVTILAPLSPLTYPVLRIETSGQP